jgi:succinate-semialdehyde dehydrogenase/glutarate-semialdehyde dehydrogenase
MNNPLAQLQQPQLLQAASLRPVAGGNHFAVHNPATQQAIAWVADMGAAQTEAAIAAANAALPDWRGRTAYERSRILRKWLDLLQAHKDDLARIMTAENGKPLVEAYGEVQYAASFVEWYAEEAKRAYGEVLTPNQPGQRSIVIKQAIGVCAAITPWNFPLAMITRKVAPALAAGCTVVLKPADLTPLSALAAAELAYQAGVPKGALHIVTGSNAKAIGDALCASDTVRHLSFTGSTAVGKLLMQQCAPTMKKLALELGGNAPVLVFDDADLDGVVAGLMAQKFRNTGQACVSPNRVLVQAGVYDAFLQRMTTAVAALKTADGFAEGAQIGPLINDKALEKVSSHVQNAVAMGARVTTGGQARSDMGAQFYAPTVLADCQHGMRVACEETFGPILSVFQFATEAEAIARANDTEYGLAAYLYSRDIARIWRVAEALEAGMVSVNAGQLSADQSPFGGIKQSGLGREGGRQGMHEYQEEKTIAMGQMV